MVAASLGALVRAELRSKTVAAIERFSCKDKDVQEFLQNKAIDFELRDKSRTYLVIEEEEWARGNVSILAYFSITMKALKFGNGLSKTKVKEIDGFSRNVDGTALLLIGQFGKDQTLAGHIPGAKIMQFCLRIAKRIQALAAGRYIMVECNDIPKVRAFYEANGFNYLQTDESDKYLQLVRRL